MKFAARFVVFTFASVAVALSAQAQSTDQNYPTAVTTNEINGTIRARDVGDSRLTTYYYTFDGSPGDLFVNVVTRNLTGDIDIFTKNGLAPLTKIVVYADYAANETGRVIYLRKPEKMILRVQGRTPSDDPATFRIKFAGGFVASTAAPGAEPELPSLTAKNESGIRVNSVGTIVEIIPKATPTPAPVEERAEVKTEETPEVTEKAEPAPEKKEEVVEAPPEKKVEVVVTENIPPAREATTVTRPPGRPARNRRRGTPPPVATEPATTESATATPPATARSRRSRATVAVTPPEPPAPDPLANINLVISFKDGTKLERPLSEVLRFTVNKGVLTVIAKDGSIGHYSMLEVAEVTIK